MGKKATKALKNMFESGLKFCIYAFARSIAKLLSNKFIITFKFYIQKRKVILKSLFMRRNKDGTV